MNRSQLEHVIRAAAAISGDSDIVVIGSQSVLGQFASPPPELCVSMEANQLLARLPTVPVDAALRQLAEQRIRAHRKS